MAIMSIFIAHDHTVVMMSWQHLATFKFKSHNSNWINANTQRFQIWNLKYKKILQKNVATHKECKRTVWTSTQEAERWITLWIYIKIVCLLDRRCKSGSGSIIVLLKLLVFYVALLLNRRLGPVLGVHCTHAVRSCLKVPWLGRASWVHCNMWGLSCGTHALRSL